MDFQSMILNEPRFKLPLFIQDQIKFEFRQYFAENLIETPVQTDEVVSYLLRQSDHQGIVFIKIKDISKETGISEGIVRKCTNLLESHGFITRKHKRIIFEFPLRIESNIKLHNQKER